MLGGLTSQHDVCATSKENIFMQALKAFHIYLPVQLTLVSYMFNSVYTVVHPVSADSVSAVSVICCLPWPKKNLKMKEINSS
jgi:hypothetical protein